MTNTWKPSSAEMGWWSSGQLWKSAAKCHESHPPLKIKEGIVVHGGAASSAPKNVDIRVSLDYGTSDDPAGYPWNVGGPVFVHFYIRDQDVPSNAAEFIKMIAWLAAQLEAGKSVHIGCIGGHGRTGMVLAALVKQMTGNEDAITYVRENYCKKAVETKEQVKFLAQHFGIKPVDGAKEKTSYSSKLPFDSGTLNQRVAVAKHQYADKYNARFGKAVNVIEFPIEPVRITGNIWGITMPDTRKNLV